MTLWTRFFGTKTRTQGEARTLHLEGTAFDLFSAEEAFFDRCSRSGQAALKLPFSEYWAVSGRGYQRKAIGGGTRLLCYRCFADMAMSFQMTLPGALGLSSVLAVGEGLPANLFESAAKGVCPWCGCSDGILLWDNAPAGDVTEADLQALRELWRQRCLLWWGRTDRSTGLCDRCAVQDLARGTGYHTGADVICEACALKTTGTETLAELRKSPDYFGTSELRRARNFAAGRWRFEPTRVVDGGADRFTGATDVSRTDTGQRGAAATMADSEAAGRTDRSHREDAMTEELVTPENVSSASLRGLLDSALFDVKPSDDGELCITAGYKLWISLAQSKRTVRFYAVFRFREQSELLARLQMVNKINDELVMLRAAVSGENRDRLWFDQYIWLEGGITKKNFLLSFKQFERLIDGALKYDTSNLLA